jgi:hypothetical protein
LTELGLARAEFTSGGDVIVVASHPRSGIGGLILKKMWAANPLAASTNTDQPLLAAQESSSLLDDLADSAGEVLALSATPALAAYRVPDDVVSALSDAIASTDREICGITARGWLPNLALVWQAITAALRRGVVYRRISDLETWIAWGQAFDRRDVRDRGIQVRVARHVLLEKFYVMDGRTSFVFESDSTPGAFVAAATRTTNAELAQRFSRRFEEIWQQCMDSNRLIAAAERLRPLFAARARERCPRDVEIALEVFDFGVYYDVATARPSVDRLREAGVVETAGTAFGSPDCVVPAIRSELLAALK